MSLAEEKARAAALGQENLRAMEMFSALAGREGPWFSAEEIAAFARDCRLEEEEAFLYLLCAACGLEPDRRREDRRLLDRYLTPALRPLHPGAYQANPYYAGVRFPTARRGAWQLGRLSFAPYQLFPRGDTDLLPDGREIAPLGYFPSAFSFPAVLENGREWMTVTPNEIETMGPALDAARGRAAVFGLGLGYFAFMASEKETVSQVTVVERDENAIALFRETLLPQFPHREKIRLVRADALEYLSSAAARPDFAFLDLWHDISDGLPLYLRLRKLESRFPGVPFAYWIEPSLLIFLRSLVLEDWSQNAGRLDRLLPKGFSSPAALTLEDVKALALSLSPGDVL